MLRQSAHSLQRIKGIYYLSTTPRRAQSAMAYPTNPSNPTDLLSALPERFEQARQSGQLFFFPSQAKDVYSGGKRFNLRSCPALLNKSKAKAEALASVGKEQEGSPDHKRLKRENGDAAGSKAEKHEQNPEEPFKPPYVPELFLGCLEGLEGEPGMSILLNKYAVLPEHMLLCPQTYEPQALPPTPHQIALAYLILVAAARHPTRPRKLLAFYNGGEGAGASQKWRHLQFIEIPNGGRAPVEEWTDVMRFDRQDEPLIHHEMKHLHVIHPLQDFKSIPYPPSPKDVERLVDGLAPAFMKSLDVVIDSIRRGGGDKNGGWNLLLTLDHLHLIPRSKPAFPLGGSDQPVELNSLGYAGMMLVRSEEEEKTLLQAVEGKGGLMHMLETCGVPREWGEKALESMSAHLGLNEIH